MVIFMMVLLVTAKMGSDPNVHQKQNVKVNGGIFIQQNTIYNSENKRHTVSTSPQTDQKNIMLGNRSKTQKSGYSMIPFTQNSKQSKLKSIL